MGMGSLGMVLPQYIRNWWKTIDLEWFDCRLKSINMDLVYNGLKSIDKD